MIARLRLRRLTTRQDGFSLIELLVTLAILGMVLAGLGTLFESGIRAETQALARHDAQSEAHGALRHLRREAHCASAATIITSAQVSLTLPTGCPTGSGEVRWCTVSAGAGRFQLYRKPGATCDATGKRYADYLTSGSAFTYTTTAGNLGRLSVDFPVDTNGAASPGVYRLTDDIVLRNSTRS